ncbi:transposase [Streptomyces avermitilis]|uniref:transposase n=1 Tax=Streptomyces avermitilis TaxID=33903 RepID=UPI003F4D00AB
MRQVTALFGVSPVTVRRVISASVRCWLSSLPRVSIRAGAVSSCPLQWRLFLPQERASDTARRALARIPADVTHRKKWRLALDMLDTLPGWGMKPPVVVADAAYGTNAHLRTALSERGLAYVLAVRSERRLTTPDAARDPHAHTTAGVGVRREDPRPGSP